MIIRTNPDSLDVILDTISDPLIKTYLAILFQFSLENELILELEELAEAIHETPRVAAACLDSMYDREILEIDNPEKGNYQWDTDGLNSISDNSL